METPVHAPLKEQIRIEIMKLREMSFRNKLEYIWEYYKVHIIAVLIVLFVFGSLINTWFINPTPDTALFISWNAGFVFDEQLTDLSEAIREQIVPETAKETVDINRIFLNDADPQIVMASMSQLVAMVAAGVIDVFILDSELLEDYSRTTFIQPLDEILTQVKALDPAAYERIMIDASYAMYSVEEDELEERLMGISIINSPLLSKLGFYEQELYFSMSTTSGNPENIAQALIVFFE